MTQQDVRALAKERAAVEVIKHFETQVDPGVADYHGRFARRVIAAIDAPEQPITGEQIDVAWKQAEARGYGCFSKQFTKQLAAALNRAKHGEQT